MGKEQKQIRKDLDKVIEKLEGEGLKHNDDYDKVGVGDVVESVLSSMGITQDRFKSWFGLSECDCNERKKWLNGMFYWKREKEDGKSD